MKDVLAMLVELQQLDDEMRDMRVLKKRLAKLNKDNLAGLAVFEKMLSERALRIEETNEFIAEKAKEIEEIAAKAKRSRGRMGTITSQRELTALNKELDTQRRLNQSRQEELTRLKTEHAEAEADHQAKQAERDGLARQMEALEENLKVQIIAKEADAVTSSAKRAELRERMPRRELSQYDRIARARKGTAIANVVDGNCSACNMRLPPFQAQKVYRLNSLERCQNCQRIVISFSAFARPEEG